MKCPNCLKEVENSNICSNCGISLSHIEDGVNIEGKINSILSSYNKLKSLIFFLIFVVIVIFILVLCFGGL